MERSTKEVVELVWMEQFLAALPQNARNWIMCNDPRTLEEAVKLMESYDIAGRAIYPGSSENSEKKVRSTHAREEPRPCPNSPQVDKEWRGRREKRARRGDWDSKLPEPWDHCHHWKTWGLPALCWTVGHPQFDRW